MKVGSGGHPGAYCPALATGSRSFGGAGLEHKDRDCAAAVGGERQPVPMGRAGGGELHSPLLPRLLIAVAYMELSC